MENFRHEIAKENGMNVTGVVYASEEIYEDIKRDKTIEQVKNVAKLKGIVGESIALPDCHRGYGFPIGGVAAFSLDKGIICPGGIGYDINCSVRLLKTNLTKKDIIEKQKEVLEILNKKIPSGVGHGSPFQISYPELDKLLEGGAKYMVEKGYGVKEDYINSEEEGCMKDADSKKVSKKAKQRGIGQIGTIGAGNHFLEIESVEEIYDRKTAQVYGLKKGQAVVLIHCGSRGLGHQVASDYIKLMEEEYGISDLPDRELINAPLNSELGKDYFKAMNAAANFAFANKQLITYWVREALTNLFPEREVKVEVLYDVCHNIAKIEEYVIDGKKMKICVHRKGATRSFGPGHKEIPLKYRDAGQPVLIPGSMGTASYVMAGRKKAEELTFGSSVHGAGRKMSRSEAVKKLSGEKIKNDLKKMGIEVSGSAKGLLEEAPLAYKNIDEVVRIVDSLGLSKKVAKLKPLVVVKG